MVRRAGGISPGTLGRRPFEAHPALCLFPVWRRPSPVHRECVCRDGSDADTRDRRAEVSATAGAESPGCPASIHYTAPSVWSAGGAGIAAAPWSAEPCPVKTSGERLLGP